ncbi:MAG: hypothetical protein WAR79_07295, partial [Melioribacteraceae bacterium]
NGIESVDQSFFTTNPTIVDWVLIELRDGATASVATTVDRKAAFVKSDGTIIDINGSEELEFQNTLPGNYFVVIYHRNHLPVMSSVKLDMTGSN